MISVPGPKAYERIVCLVVVVIDNKQNKTKPKQYTFAVAFCGSKPDPPLSGTGAAEIITSIARHCVDAQESMLFVTAEFLASIF